MNSNATTKRGHTRRFGDITLRITANADNKRGDRTTKEKHTSRLDDTLRGFIGSKDKLLCNNHTELGSWSSADDKSSKLHFLTSVTKSEVQRNRKSGSLFMFYKERHLSFMQDQENM